MILHYSSNNYSYKLGDSGAYIRKCPKGFYVDSETQPSYFSNFIFTSVLNTYYLITTSKREFVVYEITDKVKKALVISNVQTGLATHFFEYVVLKLNDMFIKVTPDLNFTNITNIGEINLNRAIRLEKHFELYECDLSFECHLPILHSLKAYAYYPYDGNMLKEFFFI